MADPWHAYVLGIALFSYNFTAHLLTLDPEGPPRDRPRRPAPSGRRRWLAARLPPRTRAAVTIAALLRLLEEIDQQGGPAAAREWRRQPRTPNTTQEDTVFRFTDPDGDSLTVEPASRYGRPAISLRNTRADMPGASAAVHVPADRVEELVQGLRDTARDAHRRHQPAPTGPCTATWDRGTAVGVFTCAGPAGHYNPRGVITFAGGRIDPGGRHMSAPTPDGIVHIWVDTEDGATPHQDGPRA